MATDVLRPNTANPQYTGKNGYNNDELVDTTIKVNNMGNVKADNVNYVYVSFFFQLNSISKFLNISQVGNSILGPGFKQHLEKFYSKASPEDKARCLELLTSINISRTLRQQNRATKATAVTPTPPSHPKCTKRPYTAMADLGKTTEAM